MVWYGGELPATMLWYCGEHLVQRAMWMWCGVSYGGEKRWYGGEHPAQVHMHMVQSALLGVEWCTTW